MQIYSHRFWRSKVQKGFSLDWNRDPPGAAFLREAPGSNSFLRPLQLLEVTCIPWLMTTFFVLQVRSLAGTFKSLMTLTRLPLASLRKNREITLSTANESGMTSPSQGCYRQTELLRFSWLPVLSRRWTSRDGGYSAYHKQDIEFGWSQGKEWKLQLEKRVLESTEY